MHASLRALAGFCSLLLFSLSGTACFAADSVPLPTVLSLKGWTGGEAVSVPVPSSVVLRHPEGKRDWYHHGFRSENDGTEDFRPYSGLRVDLSLSDDRAVELTATLGGKENSFTSKAKVIVRGAGTHRMTLPWTAFDFQQAQPGFLKFIGQVELSVRYAEPNINAGATPSLAATAGKGNVEIYGVSVAKGEVISLEAEVRGRPAPAGGSTEYQLTVGNCTDKVQPVVFSQQRYGWEAMKTTITPSTLELAPGQSTTVRVRVELPATVPAGGQEKQTILAVGNGNAGAAATLDLITASALPHPYVLHTPERWREVREKIDKYDWARKGRDEYVAQAGKFIVPALATEPVTTDNLGLHLFETKVEKDLMAAGIAYQITGNKLYAAKVRDFMLLLSDPLKGYPLTLRGCHQSLVQEGHFFQHIAMAYDMALPSGLFTDAERAQIETTFRLYIGTIAHQTSGGAINNWNLSEICGALYCALVLQDMVAAERFFSGPGGIKDQLAKGVLNDGWWYECSISYNVWCATEFSQAALAMEPWGVNFRDMRVPASTVPHYSLMSPDSMRQYGINFEKWGPITRPWLEIRQMWDALPNFSDYRGVMFGVNDATERRLAGTAYEIAYYLYRDPLYATLIKQGGAARDLLYAVPELPAVTPEKFRDSAYADNVGVAMLRSQTPGRPIREQIQAVLHYGTHGGYHGHFDRTSLLHLSRYGRSFYNPEAMWYGYPAFMYKFYVQNSTSSNMVVVDRKMQEPTESRRLLFHTGKLIQAAAVETVSRWSAPPYGGMVYPDQGYATLQEKAFGEGRFLPVPAHPPAYGELTEFTEPILQRRLMVVTDDYVILADYLKGEKEHTFESLFQMKGFKGIDGRNVRLEHHDGQWDTNPVLDAQFVTDADWYTASAPAKAGFEMRWGPGADNAGTRAPESEDGVLKLDVHTLWPQEQKLMVATVPEDHPVNKRLFWKISGDGRHLGEGKFGPWVLGQESVDIAVEGIKNLELETRVELSQLPSIFWTNARVVMRDGSEIPIAKIPTATENIQKPAEEGKDFAGGPIKIVGIQYFSAASGQPKDTKLPAKITLDLTGLDAVRFKAVLGGDYPVGNETQRRKTYASQIRGTEARFLTIIEPYEDKPVIRTAQAISADVIRVELTDGRVQEITLHNVTGNGKDISAKIRELPRSGGEERTESTDTVRNY